MVFGEKLDLLMNLTKTTNSALASAVFLDSSYISRLRTGKRLPPKKGNHIEEMALYLGKHCIEDYQKAALIKLLKIPAEVFPEDIMEVAKLIYNWFNNEEQIDGEAHYIDGFLEHFTSFKFALPKAPAGTEGRWPLFETLKDESILLGNEGKRKASLAFLGAVYEEEQPQTLLLYSDEEIDWLTEDPEFTVKWAALLGQVIQKGNRIKIVHTVNRSLGDMLAAIRQWLPIYMTGHIEPYYYPKPRDGVYRRTLFVASNTCAVTSNSIGSKTNSAANLFILNQAMILSLVDEFNSFLAICRPLMHIFKYEDRFKFLTLLKEFENEEGDTVILSEVPSILTMPQEISAPIIRQMEIEKSEQLLRYQTERIIHLKKHLKKFRHTEIINMPSVDKVLSGEMRIGFPDAIGRSFLYYSPSDYLGHLKYLTKLMRSYDNFNLHLIEEENQKPYYVYAKENVGVLVGKFSEPSAIFAINESNMVYSFYEFLKAKGGSEALWRENKRNTLAVLDKIINQLEEALESSAESVS